jgi:hypothetical protein
VTITRTQYLFIQTLFSVLLNPLILSALADTGNASFSIYCISNGDGTGNCTRDDNKKPISCIGMPGVTVECQDRKQNKYECVPFGFIDTGQAQVQLSCENKSSDNINDRLFDSTNTNNQKIVPINSSPKPKSSQALDQKPTIKDTSKPINLNPFLDSTSPADLNQTDHTFTDSF